MKPEVEKDSALRPGRLCDPGQPESTGPHPVTLTGVGGAGKTRLALRVAAEVRREFRDGVWFVDLAPLADEALVTQTVASALGLHDRTARWSVSVLAEHLSDKRLLLILDNCEHLRDGCADLVDALLRQEPGLRVPTTGRRTLGLTGEHVFLVPPLSIPDQASDLPVQAVAHYEAVSLFVKRAQAVRPSFELTDGPPETPGRFTQLASGSVAAAPGLRR